MRIDAFHLPGVDEAGIREWELREYGGGEVVLRFPVLEPDEIRRLAGRIRAARAIHLAELPVGAIVRAIDRVAALLQQRDHPARVLAETALPVITGYSPPMVRLILDRMTADWREPALLELLRRELGDPGVLDGFRVVEGDEWGGGTPGGAVGGVDVGAGIDAGPAGGPGAVVLATSPTAPPPQPVRVRAYGPELAFHIFAGNIPGVAVTSLVRSLLVKSATLGKTASGDPLLPALFAQILADVAPGIGECLAVCYWPGTATALQQAALREVELAVVYGGGETVQAVRGMLPAGVRLVEHGPRFSLAAVAREELAGDAAYRAAAGVARAVAVFDQQGCVSPHVVYVEKGGEVTPAEFAELVARELEVVERELPRGRLSIEEASAIQQLRGAAEFRALAGRDVRLFTSAGTEYTVIYDDEPGFTPSCLNRVLRVTPVADLAEIPPHLAPLRAYLQTVGLAARGERRAALADLLGRAGVSRITTLEAMPWPPPTWHHDGQEPMRELVRWVDWEG